MKLIVLLHLLLMLIGCNSEYASLSAIHKTRIKVKATLPAPITANKIMLWGQGADGTSFARILKQDEETSFIFNNANYSLYAIAWTGPDLTGDVYCSTSAATLVGPDLPLTLNLTNSDCHVPHFDGGVSPGGPLNKLGDVKVEWCEQISGVSAPEENCTDDLSDADRVSARGHAMSYRYVLSTYDKKGSKVSVKSDSIMSACLAGFPGAGNDLKGSAFAIADQLPIGDGATTPFRISLQVFPGDSFCASSTPMHSVTLENGIKKTSDKASYISDLATFHKLYVKLATTETCTAAAKALQFAGGNGSQMSPFLICDETQFYNTHQIRNSSFKLMNDIDLTKKYYGTTTLPNIPDGLTCLDKGSNFIPLGYDIATCTPSLETFPFQDFDGGGKTIKGLRIHMPTKDYVGLYTKKYGGQIRRLNLEGTSIKGNLYVGTLAGYSEARALNITGDGVYVLASSGLAGGLVGANSNHPSNCDFTNIKLSNVNATGLSSWIGGIIGQSSSCDFNSISLSGHIYGASQYIAGIAGALSNGSLVSTSFEGSVRGGNIVGGLAAETSQATINRSYVVGNIFATATGANTKLGGLIGYTNGVNSAANNLTNSYFYGKVHDFCTAGAACKISNIVGDPGGWVAGNLNTNSYLTPTAVTGKSAFDGGVSRAVSEFYSVAAWSSSYQRINEDLPRLYHEVASTTIDIKHACRSIAGATDPVATQIAAGKGSDANPILLCSFAQLKDMQATAAHATKSYKMLTTIVASEDLPPSSLVFSGKLDGTNKAIVNLTVTGAAAQDIGWWKSIGPTGVIKNVYFYTAFIKDPSASASSTALISTYNNGLIDSVHALLVHTIPGATGQHGLYVHTNLGTIKNSYTSVSGTVRENVGGMVYLNSGLLQDLNTYSYFDCNSGTNCSNISNLTIENSGTIRRVEVTGNINEPTMVSPTSNFSFVTNKNTGLIEDVHIKSTSSIISKSQEVHAIANSNRASGTIRRVYNEGQVTVYNFGLPSLSPSTSADYINGVTSTIGYNIGTYSDIFYKSIPRWVYPSQYAYVSQTPSAANECTITLNGGLPAAWETAMADATQYVRFGVSVVANEGPFLFTRPYLNTPGNDVFYVYDPTPCSMTVGNPVTYMIPYDQFGGTQLINQTQSLSPATFGSWQGVYDITTDTSPVHNYEFDRLNGVNSTKPVWIFDTTNSLRLYR